jgi:8-oxo-dGTP pyrophosphatase MutT (NUDIX family)
MRQVVRALLRNEEGKYLLVIHQWAENWTTPGGHIDEGEPVHKALKREIKEEFNLKFIFLGETCNLWIEYITELPTPIANYKIHYKSKKFWKVKKWEFIFHCEVKPWETEHLKIQEEEIAEYKWFTPEEIFELENIFPQIPLLLKKVI